MQRLSGHIIVETDVANFRNLVQRLTGLPAVTDDVFNASDETERKTAYSQHSKRSANKHRQRRPKEEESYASVTNPDDLIESSRRRRGVKLVTEQRHEFNGGVNDECGEAPELLALFPLSCSSLEV